MGRKHKKIKGQFVALLYELLDSSAWQELTSNDQAVFIRIMRQRNGYNDDALKLPYSQSKLAPATMAKAVKHLVQVGVIDIVEPGGLSKRCTVYRLSQRWRIYKKPLLPNG